MPVRRMAILVVLAAIFAMHGVPSTSADATADSTAAVAHAKTMAPAGGVGPLPAATSLGVGLAQGVAALPGEEMEGHGPSHTGAVHQWATCLAVLLLGLALLAVLLGRKPPGSLHHRTAAPSRGAPFWAGPARPPDLSALCLLRI